MLEETIRVGEGGVNGSSFMFFDYLYVSAPWVASYAGHTVFGSFLEYVLSFCLINILFLFYFSGINVKTVVM
jgi:hypothetical protein